MMKSSSFQSLLYFFSFFILCSSSTIVSGVSVPLTKTFSYANNGAPHSGLVEFNASFRPLPIENHPFRLCFFKPIHSDSYILGIGMGTADVNSLMRWVWAANLDKPVGENAKLVFNRGGNLALIDSNGRYAWQTNTGSKGVVDIKLLPNGNLVLVDKNGGFVWQSFDHPTNTLLVGQTLNPGITSTSNKLVNGAYSLVLQGKQLGLFFNPPNPKPDSSKPMNYFNLIEPSLQNFDIENVTFNTARESLGAAYANQLSLYTGGHHFGFTYAHPKYNSTLSIFRLGSDGNVYIYTYYEQPTYEQNVWEQTYATFSREGTNSECLMPEKCGSFGVCSENQCVACPTPTGLAGWTKQCKQPNIPSCNAANVGYYKLEAVNHFLNGGKVEGEGPMDVNQCMKKCSDDCKCVGFFYRVDGSMCLRTTQLYTLVKLSDDIESNKSHTAYIKYAKEKAQNLLPRN
ncbi:hypothetical protein MKX03_021602 [Papaver bracteatum]|nr:hypothetical protein MKX03_021602 [Papaver bracteatum]